jgi:hypothetical protein
MDGTWRGRSEVVEATRKNFALVSGQRPEIEGMIAQGDSVAVLLRESERAQIHRSGLQHSPCPAPQHAVKRIDEIVASLWKAEA